MRPFHVFQVRFAYDAGDGTSVCSLYRRPLMMQHLLLELFEIGLFDDWNHCLFDKIHSVFSCFLVNGSYCSLHIVGIKHEHRLFDLFWCVKCDAA